jgi:hypothetical protein
MKLLRHAWVALPVVLVVGCRGAHTGASVALGSRSLDGSIGIDDSHVTSKNSIEALGLDGSTAVLDARIDVTFETERRMHLALKGFQASHDGDGTLNEDFAKGPVTIPAGTSIDSTFDAGVYTAAWTFDLAERDDLEAGIGVGLAWIDLEASFTSDANGDEIFTDEAVPIPLLAARLAWSSDRWALGLEAAGIDVGYAGDHASFLDLDIAARWRFLGKRFGRNGELVLGWRRLYAGIDYDDDFEAVDAGLASSGPYFGLAFRF